MKILSIIHPYIVKYLNWFIDNKLNELIIAVEWAEKGEFEISNKKSSGR